MEHSALHALLLTGLIAALGGPLAVWWLILPAARALTARGENPASRTAIADLLVVIAKWTVRAAMAAVVASVLDLFVQVAELEGQTIFGGVDIGTVCRFATQTTVGQLALLRILLLLFTAGAAISRYPLATRGRPNPSASCARAFTSSRGVISFAAVPWVLTAALAFGAILATSFVSHAAAQPDGRVLALGMQIGHLFTAAAWMGVLLHLFAARSVLLPGDAAGSDGAGVTAARTGLVAELVRRFSPIALATTSLLFLSGLIAAWRFLGSFGALFTSAYGLTLFVKLVMLAPAIAAGWIHFRRIGPRLSQLGDTAATALRLFRRTLELEITAGIFVIAVAGILASVSPPGDGAALQLTPVQARAVMTPDLPTSHVENWSEEEDALGPTDDDLRYSEFTHNWSGVFVILLGTGWFLQSTRGSAGVWAARLYPFLLIPFGCFIAVLANPELWLLRQISPMEALTNPAILEHQLGAVLVFLLAWLSWRDRRNPEDRRPLGYPLPCIMIAGSLLLLGHAHSAAAVSDDLSNIINVQHCILGALGLFGGVARWYVLRGLIPARVGNYVWPSCVIALGVFLAFFYRELV